MSNKRITLDSLRELAPDLRRPFHVDYFAMYSSVYGGIVTDPILMTVPIDDHLVHRGDGVFESFKCVNGSIYNMAAHLARLEHSAASMGHRLPNSLPEISEIVVETVAAGGHADTLLRLFVSRGPGSFNVNPYDCPRQELYIVATRLCAPFMARNAAGARVISSAIPAKEPFLAGVKTCNYIPNALMKKEAVDHGVDFVASFDREGYLAEGAAENFGIVTPDHRLLFPRLGSILKGTTMIRVMALAEQLVESGDLSEVAFGDITREMIAAASEMLVAGTTADVAVVREYDGRPVGDGTPGPVYRKLSALLEQDMRVNSAVLTPVPGLSPSPAAGSHGPVVGLTKS